MSEPAEYVVHLPKVCDQEVAPHMRTDFLAALDARPDSIHIDFSVVEHMNSSGLSVILAFLATLQREAASTAVVMLGMKPAIHRIITLTRVEHFDLSIQCMEAA